ncbi:RNA polymerase sigma factor ShbA [Saccharomonospora piscinae]|uniref:RNA polymerase sigma factor ShbA n=1 Tax=Saccharomonospora piscinae TaxID=687388 RepID=UPI000466A493|nr:RNA polymerase sigma factor ShbA [Saccharomonospora piscinae]
MDSVVPAPREELTTARIDPIVRDAAEGDAHAVHVLATMITPVVTRYCRAKLGRRDFGYISADDVAQDICVAVLQALPQYRDRGGSFLFLVRAIASNKVADAFRLVARERSLPTPVVPDTFDDGNEPEHHLLNAEAGDRLHDLLGQLSPLQHDIVVLRVVVGLSARETADVLGLSPANVRTSQHRALARLRRSTTPEAW